MLLQRLFPMDALAETLLPHAAWQPYPPLADRAGWQAFPGADELVAEAEASLGEPWPELLATHFLDFPRNGDRSRMQNQQFPRRGRLATLVLAECVENQGRFLDAIADGVWLICEESYWGVSAHVGGLPDVEAPFVDLFAAETAGLLSIVDYLVGEQLDSISPLFRRRIRIEARERILTPVLEQEIGWMGLHGNPVNNWNPWIISNWLTTALLLEDEQPVRARHAAKAVRCLDCFLRHYSPDGGCDEGPGYWGRAGASLFDCLHLLHSASAGKLDAYGAPLVAEMGRFIYRMHIADRWFVNFADASALNRPGGELIYRYGAAIEDPEMMAFGAYWAQEAKPSNPFGSLQRLLPDLFARAEILAAEAATPLLRDVWLPGIQAMATRDRAGTTDGFFLAAKGGHNAESHNHNDIGTCIVFRDGLPLIIDVGVETYTAKTFSRERYTIWTMQSAYHILPTVNGVMQRPGREAEAREVTCEQDDTTAALSLELAEAWPEEAALSSWRRTLRLRRGEAVEIDDAWQLAEVKAPLQLHLMTASTATIDGDTVRLAARDLPGGRRTADGAVRISGEGWRPRLEDHPVTDSRLSPTWGDTVTRITFELAEPPARGQCQLRISAD